LRVEGAPDASFRGHRKVSGRENRLAKSDSQSSAASAAELTPYFSRSTSSRTQVVCNCFL